MKYVITHHALIRPAHVSGRLPGYTDTLVSEVLKANPNTIVVNQSGTPVSMPWIDAAHTIVQVSASLFVCEIFLIAFRHFTAETRPETASLTCYLALSPRLVNCH